MCDFRNLERPAGAEDKRPLQLFLLKVPKLGKKLQIVAEMEVDLSELFPEYRRPVVGEILQGKGRVTRTMTSILATHPEISFNLCQELRHEEYRRFPDQSGGFVYIDHYKNQ